jgi:hypothetical protein
MGLLENKSGFTLPLAPGTKYPEGVMDDGDANCYLIHRNSYMGDAGQRHKHDPSVTYRPRRLMTMRIACTR